MTRAYKGTLILTPEELSIIFNAISCYKYFYGTCEDTEDTQAQLILIKYVEDKIKKYVRLRKL